MIIDFNTLISLRAGNIDMLIFLNKKSFNFEIQERVIPLLCFPKILESYNI